MKVVEKSGEEIYENNTNDIIMVRITITIRANKSLGNMLIPCSLTKEIS